MSVKDCLQDKFVRYCFAAGLCVFFSLIWVVAACWVHWNCPVLLGQLKHQVTYTVIHFTAFPFAIGWIAAHLRRDFFGQEDNGQFKWRWKSIGLLLVLYGLMTAVSFDDLTGDQGYLLTYTLKDGCRLSGDNVCANCQKQCDELEKALIEQDQVLLQGNKKFQAAEKVQAAEKALDLCEVQNPDWMEFDSSRRRHRERIERKRKELAQAQNPQQANVLEIEIQQLENNYNSGSNPYLLKRARTGAWGTLSKGNLIVPVSMALTLLIQLVTATVVWCVLMHFELTRGRSAEDEIVQSQVRWLTTCIVAFAFWIPARAYANHYERESGMLPVSDAPVYFAGVFVILMLGLLYLDLWLRKLPSEKAKAILTFFTVGGGFVLVTIPMAAEKLMPAVDGIPPVMFLAVIFVAAIGLLLVSHGILSSEKRRPQLDQPFVREDNIPNEHL